MAFDEVQHEMSVGSRFVQTDYGTFHVESAGAGTPVLFIHGGTASAREWRPVLPLLAGHAECVAIDRSMLTLGNSASSPPRRAILNRHLTLPCGCQRW